MAASAPVKTRKSAPALATRGESTVREDRERVFTRQAAAPKQTGGRRAAPVPASISVRCRRGAPVTPIRCAACERSRPTDQENESCKGCYCR